MANVDLAFAPAPSTFPFDLSPVGGVLLPKTALPRARLIFQINDGAITAKAMGNTTTITVTMTLPRNFAYSFEYLTVQLSFATSTSDAATYEDIGMMQFISNDGVGAGRRAQLVSLGACADIAAAGSQVAYAPVNVFPSPIFNTRSVTPSLLFRISDLDAGATVAGLMAVTCSVLQYDLEQVFSVGVNFPLPVSIKN